MEEGHHEPDRTTEGNKLTVELKYTKKLRQGQSIEELNMQFEQVVHSIARACPSKGWIVVGLPEAESENRIPKVPKVPNSPSDPLLNAPIPQFNAQSNFSVTDAPYANVVLPDDWREYYKELYKLDFQATLTKQAIDWAIKSNWTSKKNVLYVGPPGCGKTTMGKAFLNMIEANSEPGAVVYLDATSTSKAGLEEFFLQFITGTKKKPRILIFEELEKVPDGNLTPMIGLLDDRGEINKTTAPGGRTKRRSVKIDAVCIGMVNDEEKFSKIHDGCLYSRFSKKVYFTLPDRETLVKVCLREIEKVKGAKKEWAEPAVDFMINDIKSYDPRIAIDILDAGDSLLDNSFQTEMRELRAKRQKDQSILIDFQK